MVYLSNIVIFNGYVKVPEDIIVFRDSDADFDCMNYDSRSFWYNHCSIDIHWQPWEFKMNLTLVISDLCIECIRIAELRVLSFFTIRPWKASWQDARREKDKSKMAKAK